MTAPVVSPELDLRRVMSAVRRRKVLIASIVLATVISALVLSLRQPRTYEGKARILLKLRQAESLSEPGQSSNVDPDLLVETEMEVLKSNLVRSAVSAKLGLVGKVGASRVASTLLIEATARSRDPGRAAAITNAYAEEYIDLRRRQETAELTNAAQGLETKIEQVRGQIAELDRQVASAAPDARAVVSAAIAGDRASLVTQETTFRQRLDEVNVSTALRSGGAEIVNRASTPGSPASPKPLRNAILAVLVGLVVALSVACILEYLDDSVTTEEDLSDAADLPVLAAIPVVHQWRAGYHPHLASGGGAHDIGAGEAFRVLRTAVRMIGIETPLRTLQVTSACPGEGKTTTLANLAIVLARAGERVVAVDCDLRRPKLHGAFGLDNTEGLTSVVVAGLPLSAALRPVVTEPGLAVLTSGPIPPNPSELLASRQVAEILLELLSMFDVILVDSPPVLGVTDPAVVSVWADGVLVVASSGATSKRQIRRAVNMLRQAEAPLAGAVLNRAQAREGYGYYGYTHTHGSRDEKRARPWRSRDGGSAHGKAGELEEPPASTGTGEGSDLGVGDRAAPGSNGAAPMPADLPQEPRAHDRSPEGR